METDHDLLFGALCVKFELLTFGQLVAATWDWNEGADGRHAALADLLEAGGLIRAEQRAKIERVMSVRLAEFDGDARRTLSDVMDEDSLLKLTDVFAKKNQQVMTLIEPISSSPSTTSGTWNAGSTQERYRLGEETGHGGLGQVWMAHDLDLNRRVALKTIKPKFARDEGIMKRFVREAQITGQLEHPNVIRVYELQRGADGQRPYFSMQLIRDKRTLKSAIREYHDGRRAGQADPVMFNALLSAFVSICQALAYAHSRGVLHRDLKPQNVMLGHYGEAIVIDWGLAKFEVQTEENLTISQISVTESGQIEETQSGQVLGTPGYLAPEQAAGRLDLVDARTDVYCLGGILFDLLTDRTPHPHLKILVLLKHIEEQPSPVAKQVEPSIPAALDAICSKALAKKREDRYQNALDLADDVRRWLAGEPVSVYREPWPDRLLRWLRKHRAAATSAAVVLLVVAVSTTVASLLINQARGREQLAKQTAVEFLSEAENAVNVSLTGVDEVLKFYPSTQAVRQRLLEQAAKDFARFSKLQSDDRGLQLEAARAQLRLGNVRLQLNQFETAVKEFDAADLKLAAIESQLPMATFERGVCAAQRGEALFRDARNNEARAAYERSVELLERGAATLPADSSRRVDVADARVGLAGVLQQLRETDNARRQLTQSLKQLEPVASQPLARDARRIAAKGEHALGQLEMAAGQLDAAGSALARALQHYSVLLTAEKNFPVWLDGQALCRVTLANLKRRQGRDREALDLYRKAVDDFDDLARAIPGVPHYEHARILARNDAALFQLVLGQARSAELLVSSSIGRAIQLVENEPTPDLIETTAVALAAYGAALRDSGQLDHAEEALNQSQERFKELTSDRRSVDVRRRMAVVVSQLAYLAAQSGRFEEGLELFRQADEELQQLIADDDADAISKNALAASCCHWADALFAAGRRDEATKLYRRANDLWRELPEEVELHLGQLWLLLTCPDESLRDLALAAHVAEQLLSQVPDNARLLALLSLAKARLSETDTAERLAKQSRQMLDAGNSTAAFVLALVEHQRGQKEKAAAAFEAAIKQMTEQHPASWSARRLREMVGNELGLPITN